MDKKLLVIATILLSMIGPASAYAVLTVSPTNQSIYVGSTGSYTLTLNTDYTGSAFLTWVSDDSLIWAGINAAPSGPTGSISFSSDGSGSQTFTLNVQPQTGVTVGSPPRDVTVAFSQGGTPAIAKAIVTASVEPIPEMSTVALMSAGLLGLFGLVRTQRRE